MSSSGNSILAPEPININLISEKSPTFTATTLVHDENSVDKDLSGKKRTIMELPPSFQQQNEISPPPETDFVNNSSNKKRHRRHRVLVDMHNQEDDQIKKQTKESVETNEYEQQRLQRIARNEEVMRQLGLRQLAADTAVAYRNEKHDVGGEEMPKPRRHRPKTATTTIKPPLPRRQPSRHTTAAAMSCGDDVNDNDDDEEEEEGDDHLLDLQEYFKRNEIDFSAAVTVNGHFSGWVPPHIAESYGLPLHHPGEEWLRAASRGGNSTTTTTTKKKKGGKKSQSDAKTKSAGCLSSNPNAYFYRHVAPNKQQAQGEWSAEEQGVFMEVVRQFGVGDNWGLFASHIAERVGYQCSAFYRDVIVPSGTVLDDRFKITRTGKAVFARR